MRITLLISLVLGYYCGLSQGFSKSGTEDLYLYKGTVLFKDGNGFIANVQKNFDSISVLPKYGEIFLRVIREKENKSAQSIIFNSGLQAKTTETIIRNVSHFQIDTITYGKTKEYTKQGQNLQGNNLAYFLEQDNSLGVGEKFYFNCYAVVMSNHLVEEFGMPVLTIERNFNFSGIEGSQEGDDEEDISVVETGNPNFPYELNVPEALKNKVYHKTSSYEGRQIADYYKKGNSQFFAIIYEQTGDTSFMLGSMHSTELAFWNKKINQPELFQRLSSCGALYFEFVRQEMQQDEIIKEPTAVKAPYPHGKTLENYLTPEQKVFLRKQYDTWLKKNGIVYDYLVGLHPELVYKRLFQNVFFAERDVILELVLAHAIGKHLIKKGDIDFEFASLDNEKEIIEVENFSANYYTPEMLINKLKTMETYMKSIWLSYEDGDIEKNWKLIKSEFGQSFYDTLIAKRNNNWTPRIIKAMQKQRCFFVVGAAHLGGPQGLLNLLKEKGCRVLPLKWLN